MIDHQNSHSCTVIDDFHVWSNFFSQPLITNQIFFLISNEKAHTIGVAASFHLRRIKQRANSVEKATCFLVGQTRAPGGHLHLFKLH